VPQAAALPRPRVICKMVRTFERWDCINAGQRESAAESRFEAWTSLLTSQASRRTPPNCGAFRFQPRGSPLRQTACWRETDSNFWSHLTYDGDAFQNTYSASPPGCTAPEDGPAENGMRVTNGSSDCLSMRRSGEHRYFLIALTGMLPFRRLGVSGTSGSNPLSSSGESGANLTFRGRIPLMGIAVVDLAAPIRCRGRGQLFAPEH
jgi:hypothetical protein